MGLGPFSSDSTSKQDVTSATDQAQINKKSTIAQGQSVLVGKGGNAGFQGGDIQAAKGSTVNVTYGDGSEAVADLTNQFLSSIGKITDGQADQTKTLTEHLAELLAEREQAAQADTSAEQSSGLTTIQKTLFGLGALFLIYKWLGSRKA